MLEKEILTPPDHIYPIDEWRVVEKKYSQKFLAQNETIFALGNGYFGMRGAFEEGLPVFQSGTFVNGFYESWPIVYGEEAFGYAKTGQTMLNVTDSRIIKLYVDDEPFVIYKANLIEYERALNMKEGTLDRQLVWETPSGKKVAIRSRRMVSFEHRHVAAIEYEVTLLDAKAPVVIVSQVNSNSTNEVSEGDPRLAKGFQDNVLHPVAHFQTNNRLILVHETRTSMLSLACGIDHSMDSECTANIETSSSEDEGQVVFSIDGEPGKPIRLVKYICYHNSGTAPPKELRDRVDRTLDRAVNHGFDKLLNEQQEYMDKFWYRSDVQLEIANPRAQQYLRFNLYHLLQASARAEGVGIPAKGLTGQAYEGHYFWDSEIYVLPFYVFMRPEMMNSGDF